jgi:hypothetical protein
MFHINDRVKVLKTTGNCLPGSKGKIRQIDPDSGNLSVDIYEDAYGNAIMHKLVACPQRNFTKDEVTLHSKIRKDEDYGT